MSVAVSTKATSPAPNTETNRSRPSGVSAIPCGAAPTSIVFTTVSVLVSMTLTTDAPSLLT